MIDIALTMMLIFIYVKIDNFRHNILDFNIAFTMILTYIYEKNRQF